MAAALVEPPPVAAPVVDDQALIAATLTGRPDAFGELVSRYERAVYNLAVRTLRDRTEAELQMRRHIQQVRDYVLEADSEREHAVVSGGSA